MEGDGFGGVAISGNGKIMAVSAHGADINGFLDAGYVRLFDKDGTDWNMLQQINGSYASHRFGYSIDLSHDGSMLGIGAYTGPAYMYEFSNTSSLYESIYTTSIVDVTEVSVSGDGSTFGVTFTTGWTKYARIFGRVGAGFQELGSPINGYGTWRSGIALNYDGTIAAIGDRAWSSSRGRFGVFQWTDGNGDGSKEWIQMGSYSTGNYVDDYFAFVGGVSITYDGLTVAIGAPFWGSDNKGLVRVYNYTATTNTWIKVLDRVGDNSGDELHHTSLSSDGKYLTVGSRLANFLYIFQKNGSNYEIVGNKVTSGEEGQFGQAIDMSADGGVVATSNPQFDNNRGRAYLLIRNNPSLMPSPLPSALPSFDPTELPTQTPSFFASSVPSTFPSFTPSEAISHVPSVVPTKYPSSAPSGYPSFVPSEAITQIPSLIPTKIPSSVPSASPSGVPSEVISHVPSVVPTEIPSSAPSAFPSGTPSAAISQIPSVIPTKIPSSVPSTSPSGTPSAVFSQIPSVVPTKYPSFAPSEDPSFVPSEAVTQIPSFVPSTSPSGTPSKDISSSISLLPPPSGNGNGGM